MKKTHYLLIGLLAVTACGERHTDPSKAALLKSLDRSNIFVVKKNESLYASLMEKEEDLYTHERAQTWVPMANAVKKLSESMIAGIDSLAADGKPVLRQEL